MKKLISLSTIILLLLSITSCTSKLEPKGKELNESQIEELVEKLQEYIQNEKNDYYENWFSVDYKYESENDYSNGDSETRIKSISGIIFESASIDEFKAKINIEEKVSHFYLKSTRIDTSSKEIILYEKNGRLATPHS
jgi:hypothetical protein